MDLYTNMLVGAMSAGYGQWLTTTLLLYVMISAVGTIIGQDWWTPLGKVWVRWCLLGPLTLAWWILRNVVGGIWNAFFPKKSKNQKNRNAQRVRNTYNISFTLFGGDRNSGQNRNQQGQRRRRGQRNRNP